MRDLLPYLLIVWMVAMVGIFPLFRHPRRAVLFIVISGMLFLPEAVPNIVRLGPIHFKKDHAIYYSAFFGTLIFSGRLFSLKLTVVDVPAILWCLCPIPSVLTNNAPPDGTLVLWDAFSQTWEQIVNYGFPYLLGRMYFTDLESFRELGFGIVTGALIYVPLCLFEVRMSPQLHTMVYGYSQHDFMQSLRFDGYRPLVFFGHGLSLALFMTSSTMFACLMSFGGEFRRSKLVLGGLYSVFQFSPCVLIVTLVLLKSTGALILGVIGVIVYLVAWLTKSLLPLGLLAIVPIVFVSARIYGWTGESVIQFSTTSINEERAKSLEFRMRNEDMLVTKALVRPWFGWGGWGRNRVYDEETGNDLTITDGLWIIILGDRGFFGLLAFAGYTLLPVVGYSLRFAPWKLQCAPATAGALVLVLFVIDCLPNAMAVPIYYLIAGGLNGLRTRPKMHLILSA